MNFNTKAIWITGVSCGIGKVLGLVPSQQNDQLVLSRPIEALAAVKMLIP